VRPLAGAVAPTRPLDVGLGAPRKRTSAPAGYRGAIPLLDFFDAKGLSLVAGRAAILPAGGDPDATVANAARAGAVAVLFYGAELPAGGIALDENGPIPAVTIPERVAERLMEQIRKGRPATASLGAVRTAPNSDEGKVARFSSTGLAFDSRVKPELVAQGVALETAEPGSNPDGSARYGTVNGTSAAAALVAGGAALLAQGRPDLDAVGLKSLLVGSARPIPGEPVTAQGLGLVDVGGAAASEVAVVPTSLGLGRADGRRWRGTQELELRNVSMRRLRLTLELRVAREGAAALDFTVTPRRVAVPAGGSVRVRIRARVNGEIDGTAPAEGMLAVTPIAGNEVRVPWSILFGRRTAPPLGSVRLSAKTFTPSDATPALLSFVAGSVTRAGGRLDVRPLSRLDLELWSPTGGKIGLLARLRNVLPGRYSFGVTGRDPTGQLLPDGDYDLRLLAWGTDPGPPTVKTLRITIE
jgi:hypothetical protein